MQRNNDPWDQIAHPQFQSLLSLGDQAPPDVPKEPGPSGQKFLEKLRALCEYLF